MTILISIQSNISPITSSSLSFAHNAINTVFPLYGFEYDNNFIINTLLHSSSGHSKYREYIGNDHLYTTGDKRDKSGLSSQTVPILVQNNQLSDIDWQYPSEPSENGICCEWYTDNGTINMPRGTVQ